MNYAALKIYTQPAVEPVSLQEMKQHLRLDSGAFSNNLTTEPLVASGSHAVTTVGTSPFDYHAQELMTLDVAPGGAGWAAGDTITGNTSAKTCVIVEKLTATTYTVWNRTGNYTLGEILTNGTATADQGAAFPTFARPYSDVLGYSAIVNLNSGTNLAGGTNDTKIQESDDHVTWNDWTGGAFTQVTTANDNANQEKAYTGTKQYLSVVSKVLVAACSFSVSVLKYSSDATEDALLLEEITAARAQAEVKTHRQLITATWDLYFDEFPSKNFFEIPFGQLQSVTSLAYTDNTGSVTTMTVTTDYLVDTNSDPGRIVLPYGVSWPLFTPYPVNPIKIRFVCGYGDTAADIDARIKTFIKMWAQELYNNRSATHTQQAGNVTRNKVPEEMLIPFRLWSF